MPPVLSLKVPGLRPFEIKFPENGLPVCSGCIKMSRCNCRIKFGHTSAPAKAVYLCISLYTEAPLVENKRPFELQYLQNRDHDNLQVCEKCFKDHKTVAECRKGKGHRGLPHSTEYVQISLEGDSSLMDVDEGESSSLFEVKSEDFDKCRSFFAIVAHDNYHFEVRLY
jgi:hypothetical protein